MSIRFTARAAFAVAAIVGGAGASAQKFDPALAASPPPVSQATLQWLAVPTASGNAVLRARFADKRAKTPVVIEGGLGPTPLRDDGLYPDIRAGDGEYAALVNVNTEALLAERARRIQLAPKPLDLPVFTGRQLVGSAPYTPPTLIQPKPDIAVPLDVFKGFWFTVDPERELIVRNLLVVDDPARTFDACTGTGTPMGAWTFGRLMTEIANQPVTGIDPAALAEHWVGEWLADQAINGATVGNRAGLAQTWLNKWPRLPDGRLHLARAPFRLMAIVNRQDLGTSSLYGGGGGGEARLVFGALDCHPDTFSIEMMQLTVIFEYDTQKRRCAEVRDWAQQWTALGTLPLGSPAYNAALQAITDQFTLANAKPTQLPNRSALKQLRTNDLAFGSPWELRESRLGVNPAWPGWFENGTTAQTPAPEVETATPTRLRDYINTNQAALLAGSHVVPAEYPVGQPFIGAHAFSGAFALLGHVWNVPGIVDLEARHKFAFATCDGCHNAETRAPFVHIRPRLRGAESALSDFLTGAGMPKSDPVSGVSRTFNELLARRMKLDAAAHMSCRTKLDFAVEELFLPHLPRAFVH